MGTKGVNRKLLYGVLLTTLIILVTITAYYLFFHPRPEKWTAAIVDQLTIQEGLANPSFVANCTSVLNSSGFEAKYYPGQDIDVGFYKDLPSNGGKIIILRVHSTVRNQTDYVDLFTSEPYVTGKYYAYGEQVSRAKFLIPPFTLYFAIGPTFVYNPVNPTMRGNFDNSLIILMGCESLNKTTMAEALVKRGAKAVIGWTRLVDLYDTDKVTLAMLDHLLVQRYTIGGAVSAINRKLFTILGHFPRFGAQLAYYPTDVGNDLVETRESSQQLFVPAKMSVAPIMVLPIVTCKRR